MVIGKVFKAASLFTVVFLVSVNKNLYDKINPPFLLNLGLFWILLYFHRVTTSKHPGTKTYQCPLGLGEQATNNIFQNKHWVGKFLHMDAA